MSIDPLENIIMVHPNTYSATMAREILSLKQRLSELETLRSSTIAVDWAKPGVNVTIETKIVDGKIVDQRIIPPNH